MSYLTGYTAGYGEAGTVTSYLTTPDQAHLLESQTSLPLIDASGVGTPTVTVDSTQRYQTMDGFGASLTESAASVLAALPTVQRSQVINSLFSPTSGAGLSFLRQPMGASDFALSNYTYDDMPTGQTDPTLANFSISRDMTAVIPQLQQALAANPAINIMATPWSPPAWMKTGDSLLGNGGTLRTAAYDAYASYFVKFLQGYAAQGVPVGTVTIQNEPENGPGGYPGMLLSAADEAAFIPHLNTALRNAGLSTKIVAFDHNWDLFSYAESVLSDSTAGPLVDGVAFHCYGGDVSSQNTVHDAYPGKNIYFTECSGGDWSTDFAANLNWDTTNLVIGATRNWAKTVAKWNLALDTNHGPTNGGCMNCNGLITVNTTTGVVTYNDAYYTLGQIAKVALPGAVRIASTSDPSGVETVAFQNQNGSYALLTHNTTGSSAPLTVREGQYAFQTTLPAGAVQSFIWSTASAAVPITLADTGSGTDAISRTITTVGVGTVDVGNTLTYTVTGLSPSTSYTIVVRAYDSGGVRGADSSPLSVTTAASATVPITLADTCSAADAISRTIATIPKTLADTGAGVDAVSYTLTGGPTSKSLADASSAAVDFLSYAGSRSLPLADTGAGVDALSWTQTGGPPTQVPLADVAFPAVDALTHTGGMVTPPTPAPDFEKLEWIDPDGIAIPLTQRISGKGRWMPPVRIVRDQYAGLLGTRARQVTLDTASVLVPVLVTASTADDYRNLIRAMASSLNPLRGPGKLRATLTHPDASVTVREMVAYYTAGMDLPEDQLDVGIPSLLFNSEGPPYWTDAADTTITYTNNATAYTWFPLGGSPWTPLILNQSTIFAQDTVINDGDAPVYPIWSLTGPASGVIQLDNQTSGKSLWFDYTMTSGQTAVIVDTRPGTKSITQGPVSLYRYLTAWDMWPLEPGRNDIVLTVPGATAATQVSRTYRRGFLAA